MAYMPTISNISELLFIKYFRDSSLCLGDTSEYLKTKPQGMVFQFMAKWILIGTQKVSYYMITISLQEPLDMQQIFISR